MEKFSMTKVEMFNAIKGMLVDDEQIRFIDHEIELVNKRNTHKSTKVNEEKVALQNTIVEFLTNHPSSTCTEIFNGTTECWKSVQQTNAILKTLKEEGKVVRIANGKRVTFRLA